MNIETQMQAEVAHHEAVKQEVEKREKTKLEKRRRAERILDDIKLDKESSLELEDFK